MVPSTGAPSVPRLSPGGCRQRPPGATVREQSGPGTSRPRASSRDAPPPAMDVQEDILVSTCPDCPPPSECSLVRPPRPPACRGPGPGMARGPTLENRARSRTPENVPFQQKWTRGWHSTRCRHITRSRESTGEGTAAPRDGGRGTEKASALGPALYFRPKANTHN